MPHEESGHALASWTRSPVRFASAITVLGTVGYAASLVMPVGLAAVVVASAAAVATVAGVLTLMIVAASRVLGLRARADRVIAGGRTDVLFPGAKPPQPAGGAWSRHDAEQAGRTIDLTEPTTVDLVPARGERVGG